MHFLRRFSSSTAFIPAFDRTRFFPPSIFLYIQKPEARDPMSFIGNQMEVYARVVVVVEHTLAQSDERDT